MDEDEESGGLQQDWQSMTKVKSLVTKTNQPDAESQAGGATAAALVVLLATSSTSSRDSSVI